MVCGYCIDVTSCNSCPKCLTTFLALHGRRAYKVSAVLSLVYVAGKLKILGTCLGIYLKSVVLGLCYGLNAVLIGKMHYVELCTCGLSQLYGSDVRLGLYKFGS